MTSRPILKNPDTTLRTPSKKVVLEDINSARIQTLIDDLIETMKIENGIGIAAPQIGIHEQIIIVDDGHEPVVLINPNIISRSSTMIDFEEGCLSLPGVYGIVQRHKNVEAEALDRQGNPVLIKGEGLLSVVLQHETDHLEGILFIDKVVRYTNPPRL
ncbi:TPA: peptide deformylase [Candidatus Uhrbacteria bacterium]|nr:peptide deformylase [Candidatus Uhrbacteria bacterium]